MSDRPDSNAALIDKLIEEVREKDQLERKIDKLEERVSELEDKADTNPSPSDEESREDQEEYEELDLDISKEEWIERREQEDDEDSEEHERESKIDPDNPIETSSNFDNLSYDDVSRQVESFLDSQEIAKTSNTIFDERFGIDIKEREMSTRTKFYDAVRRNEKIKKEDHPEGGNRKVYFTDIRQYEKLIEESDVNQENIDIDLNKKIKESEYEKRKYAIGKLLPEKGEFNEVARDAAENSPFASFSDYYNGDSTEIEEDAWEYICTSSKFKKKVKEDLDTEFDMGFENRGNSMILVLSR